MSEKPTIYADIKDQMESKPKEFQSKPSTVMENPDRIKTPETPLRPIYQLILFWTIFIIGFAAWDSYQLYLSQLNTAKAVARYNFNKDMVYRSWATMHGGVYVPITESTPPNPYLANTPERDITTPSGKRLTLMNPAYMTRQAHEIGREQFGMQGHITSLKPIRPENRADKWETGVLREFEKGATEVTSMEMIDGKPYIRFMKSLMVEEGCLKCHAFQGYKAGDVRGGISTSLSWAPYRDRILGAVPGKAAIFGIIWIVGVVSTLAARQKLLRYLDARNRAEDEKLSLQQQFMQAHNLESLGVLAGGIAHDFNNILGVIIGHCGLVRLRPEKAMESIQEIEKGAERAAVLCRQMLAYAGKTQSFITRIDMAILVNDILRIMGGTLPMNVVILPELAADLPLIKGDLEQLRQIVMNLILNAVEAIGEAEDEIRISLTKAEIAQGEEDYFGMAIQPGRYLCLEVTDNGCGMDEATRSRIFEPFFTTRFFGRGLGMSALLGIITSHRGALQLFSQPGQGTTVKAYLP